MAHRHLQSHLIPTTVSCYASLGRLLGRQDHRWPSTTTTQLPRVGRKLKRWCGKLSEDRRGKKILFTWGKFVHVQLH